METSKLRTSFCGKEGFYPQISKIKADWRRPGFRPHLWQSAKSADKIVSSGNDTDGAKTVVRCGIWRCRWQSPQLTEVFGCFF
jgi:hypothetical protein